MLPSPSGQVPKLRGQLFQRLLKSSSAAVQVMPPPVVWLVMMQLRIGMAAPLETKMPPPTWALLASMVRKSSVVPASASDSR